MFNVGKLSPQGESQLRLKEMVLGFVILGLYVGFFLVCMALHPEWFNDRWEVLSAGSWVCPEVFEEDKLPAGCYTISYPRADLSDLWR